MTKMHDFDGYRLSDKQLDLLRKRVKENNSALVRYRHAENLYSGKEPAKSALKSLISQDILERESETKYVIKELPPELIERWRG